MRENTEQNNSEYVLFLHSEIYRPVSILPLVLKLYERVLYKQTSNYFEPFSYKILRWFRKANSIQHALFVILASWQKSLDKEGCVSSILMGLLKVYDYLPHDTLLAKLQAGSYNKDCVKLTVKLFNKSYTKKWNRFYI